MRPPALQFEIAAIKPVDLSAPYTDAIEVHRGGKIVICCRSLKSLILTAFQLQYWQVPGGDSWIENESYSVVARPSEAWQAKITNLRHTLFTIEDTRLREMLQSLLIDRFQLQFHFEAKTGDIYLLKQSGKTLRLHPAETPTQNDDSNSFGNIGYAGGTWVLSATSMPQLAKFASDFVLHAQVIDRTELTGAFDYRQRVPDADPDYRDNSASFLRLIPELGLKLERTKGPVQIFRIDHAVRPSAN